MNAGRVFAGIVGTPTRRTYTFYGDAINTAARIMARASNQQLLARAEVLERAFTTYAETPIEPFAAKGKAELVHASLPLAGASMKYMYGLGDAGFTTRNRGRLALTEVVLMNPALDELVARCLEKTPERRFRERDQV